MTKRQTKSQLIKWSAGRDALNFLVIGQIPIVSQLLDLPLFIMHYNYAGPAAIFTLLEMIPVVGILPFFTIAAMLYPNRDTPAESSVKTIDSHEVSSIAGPTTRSQCVLIDAEAGPVIKAEDERPFVN